MLAIGVNHKTAPISLRERAAFTPDILPNALQQVIRLNGVQEAVILSTCNRTELYSVGGEHNEIKAWMSDFHGVDQDLIYPCTYWHQGRDAVGHLIRVASGLDSMVLGEAEILGQMKQAYSVAEQSGTVGGHFKRLFPAVFAASKTVRTNTKIGADPVSIASAAVSMAKRIFSDLSRRSVLLIGAGSTTELVTMHLCGNGVKRVVIANRDVNRAQELAQRFHGHHIGLSEIPLYLKEADIVVTATASPLPILGKGAVESAIKLRKHRPMFLVDLAVPRDVESEVSQLDDVYLYNIDDLQKIVEENMNNRTEAAEQAKAIIDLQASQFTRELQALDAANSIKEFRQSIEVMREQELAKALDKIRSGESAEHVLAEMARSLSNKIMHQPTIRMRQAAYDGRHDVVALVKDLFG